MPQLDPTTFVSQLFWLGVCFLALYFIMSYIAVPRISRTLEKREAANLEKINAASTFRERAEDLLAEYEKIIEEARAQAHDKTKQSADAVLSEIEEKKKHFLEKVNDRLHLGEQELYRARVKAEKDIQPLSQEIAAFLLGKLTGGEYVPEKLIKKRKKD